MNRILRALLLITLSIPSAFAEDPCEKCMPCTSYPVRKECVECCGVASGKIKESTQTELTVYLQKGGEATFGITKGTKIEGNLEKGASVRVVYRTRDKVAGLIEVNPRTARPLKHP